MNPVHFLESWYLAQANGEWEHSRGITIETLDNPGWMITIDLIETPLHNITMPAVREERTPRDWLICEVDNNQFRGQGDPQKLYRILELFQNWASMATKVQ
jgi:hypothetical protein